MQNELGVSGFVYDLGCTVRECIGCGCLVPGGASYCRRCIHEQEQKKVQAILQDSEAILDPAAFLEGLVQVTARLSMFFNFQKNLTSENSLVEFLNSVADLLEYYRQGLDSIARDAEDDHIKEFAEEVLNGDANMKEHSK